MSEVNIMSVEEVAEFLATKTVTIKRYAREGLLDSKEQDGQLVFEKQVVERFKEFQTKLKH